MLNKIYYQTWENNLFEGYGHNSLEEQFECQTQGVISDSIVQNWTLQALSCYKLGSDCERCSIKKAKYSFKCQMKRVVDILLKTQGLPDEKAIIAQSKKSQFTDVA